LHLRAAAVVNPARVNDADGSMTTPRRRKRKNELLLNTLPRSEPSLLLRNLRRRWLL